MGVWKDENGGDVPEVVFIAPTDAAGVPVRVSQEPCTISALWDEVIARCASVARLEARVATLEAQLAQQADDGR